MTRHYQLEWALLDARLGAQTCAIAVTQRWHASSASIRRRPPRRRPERRTRSAGFVVPGMPNAHSHAFQRGMAGNTEYRFRRATVSGPGGRPCTRSRIASTAEDLKILATQLFMEMLKAGYTSVAEFHYLHRRPNGDPYAGANDLWDAVTAAAQHRGHRLDVVCRPSIRPAISAAGRSRREQARFALDTERFLRAIEERISAERQGRDARMRRTGAAFHSLRAVRCESLREAVLRLRDRSTRHARAHPRRRAGEGSRGLQTAHRPAAHRAPVGARAGRSTLVPGACDPRNASRARGHRGQRGDGLRIDQHGGESRRRILRCRALSESRRTPLRRLRQPSDGLPRRGTALDGIPGSGCASGAAGCWRISADPHVGTRLWRDAAIHGAQAIGQPVGSIAVGRARRLAGARSRRIPAWPARAQRPRSTICCSRAGARAIRDVMVAGRWVVKDRQHAGGVGVHRSVSGIDEPVAGRRPEADLG